jgi:hypothetical protein
MKNKKIIFEESITPEELERILQKIDENLAGASGLGQANVIGKTGMNFSRYTLPIPAPVPDFNSTLTVMRNADAPYYVIDGSLPSRIIKKTFNLFIKVFGRKQAYYNALNLNILNLLVSYIHTLQQQNNSQVNMINDLVNSVAQLEDTMEELYVAQASNNHKMAENQTKHLKPKPATKHNKISRRKK